MDEELDIFQDTTAEEKLFADTVAMAEETAEEERLYDYTNQREDGGSQNLYWGNYSKQVTEDELRELFNADDNARLRESFGTFENYLAYMNERQDLIDAGEYKADWWDTGVALVSEETLADPEAGMDDKAFEYAVMQEGANQGQIGYEEQEDVFKELYTKYTGEDTTKYLDNGAKYEWNGTSFVLTQEAFGAHLGSIVGEVAATAIISGAATAGMSMAISSLAGVSTSTANAIANAAVSAMTGQDLDPADALSFAFNKLLPGSGEVVEASAIENAIDQMVGIITNPNNYIKDETGGVEVVWDDIDYEGVEGEFDPDDPDNAYNPELIDPQLPTLPTEEEGGGGASEDASADADNDGVPDSQDPDDTDPNIPVPSGGETPSQYEVIGQLPDGRLVVRDNEDGDIWYVEGDYQKGDVIPESEMGEAVGGPGTLDNGPTDMDKTDTDGDGLPDEEDGWPNIPNLPGIDPTIPGNPLPDGSVVPSDEVDAEGVDDDTGDVDTGEAVDDSDGDGTEGTGEEGEDGEGKGDDGTGEGEGGDGEGQKPRPKPFGMAPMPMDFDPVAMQPISAGAYGQFPLEQRMDFPIVNYLFSGGGAYAGGMPGLFEGMI